MGCQEGYSMKKYRDSTGDRWNVIGGLLYEEISEFNRRLMGCRRWATVWRNIVIQQEIDGMS